MIEFKEIGIFESEVVANPHGFSYSGIYNGRHYHLSPETAKKLLRVEEFWESINER